MLKNFVSSKKSSTFAAGFQKLECSGSPEILIFGESVAQHGALYKGIARSRASVNASAVSLAQLVEQLTLNQWVEGSSPSGDTTKSHPFTGGFFGGASQRDVVPRGRSVLPLSEGAASA